MLIKNLSIYRLPIMQPNVWLPHGMSATTQYTAVPTCWQAWPPTMSVYYTTYYKHVQAGTDLHGYNGYLCGESIMCCYCTGRSGCTGGRRCYRGHQTGHGNQSTQIQPASSELRQIPRRTVQLQNGGVLRCLQDPIFVYNIWNYPGWYVFILPYHVIHAGEMHWCFLPIATKYT